MKRIQIFIECSAVTKKNVDTLFKEICRTIQAASLQTPNTTCFGARKSLRDLSNQKSQQSIKKSSSKMSKLKVTKSPHSPKTPRTPNRRLPLRLQQFRKQKLTSLFWYFRIEMKVIYNKLYNEIIFLQLKGFILNFNHNFYLTSQLKSRKIGIKRCEIFLGIF